jgi:hypothetical protein
MLGRGAVGSFPLFAEVFKSQSVQALRGAPLACSVWLSLVGVPPCAQLTYDMYGRCHMP